MYLGRPKIRVLVGVKGFVKLGSVINGSFSGGSIQYCISLFFPPMVSIALGLKRKKIIIFREIHEDKRIFFCKSFNNAMHWNA